MDKYEIWISEFVAGKIFGTKVNIVELIFSLKISRPGGDYHIWNIYLLTSLSHQNQLSRWLLLSTQEWEVKAKTKPY